jgi:hypothetical protein
MRLSKDGERLGALGCKIGDICFWLFLLLDVFF